MKNIALYCRVSSREQAIHGYGIDDQERRCKEYIDIYYAEEKPNVTLFREEGVSARNIDRPQLQKIIELIKQKKIDILVVYTYDRLTRRLKDFISLLELMEKNNVILDSVKEQFNTSSATGRMFVHMIVAMAEWEEDTISERTNRGLAESAKQGNFCKAKAPFGYDKITIGKKKTLAINDEKSKIVKKIFQLIANDGLSAFAVSKKMKEELQHGYWNDQRIQAIVTNKIYYGTFVFHGAEYENQVPAIVSYETWIKANTVLKDLRHNVKFSYYYKGYMICDKCNRTLSATCGTSDTLTTYLYYYCPECKKYFSQNKFEKKVNEQFSNIIKTEKMIEVFKQSKKNIEEIQREIEKTNECISKGIISEEFGNKEIKDASNRLKDLIEKKGKEKGIVSTSNYLDLNYDEKRNFLSRYVNEIKVDMVNKSFVIIYWFSVIMNEELCLKYRKKINFKKSKKKNK